MDRLQDSFQLWIWIAVQAECGHKTEKKSGSYGSIRKSDQPLLDNESLASSIDDTILHHSQHLRADS